MDLLKCVQKRATEMLVEMERLCYEYRLRAGAWLSEHLNEGLYERRGQTL